MSTDKETKDNGNLPLFSINGSCSTDDEKKISCIIENACPDCGGDVYDGTGTGWEMCMKCGWMA